MALSVPVIAELKEALVGVKRVRDEDAYGYQKIANCIPNKPVPFTKNIILLTAYDRVNRQNVTALSNFSKAFDVIIPDKQDGIRIQKTDDFTQKEYERQNNALDCLKSFWTERQSHEKSLAKIKDEGYSETKESVVLAVHLFSKLVPKGDDKVILDRNMKGLKDCDEKCPCGCGTAFQSGDTGIGDPNVWYGYPDMLVKYSAIAVAPLDTVVDDSDDTILYDPEGGDHVAGPSQPKRQKKEEQDQYYTVEIKKQGQKSYESAFNEQVVSQCLTNAFAQKSKKNFSKMLVPSIGCTLDKVVIWLYDPVQDILLRRLYDMQLLRNGSLLLESVIELWIILNLNMFKPVIGKKVGDESGFLKFLQETKVLEIYENLHSAVGRSILTSSNEDVLKPNYRFVNFDGLQKT